MKITAIKPYIGRVGVGNQLVVKVETADQGKLVAGPEST